MDILCNGRDCTPGHCTEAAVAMAVDILHQVACPRCALAYVYVPLTDCPVTVANPCITYYYIHAYWLHHWT